MSKDEVIAWVRQKVDLFAMVHGAPTFMHVNAELYEILDRRSKWMDTEVRHSIECEGFHMELFGDNCFSIEKLTSIPMQAAQ